METTIPPRWQTVRAGLLTAHLTRSGGGVYSSVRQLARMLDAAPGIEVDVFGPGRLGDKDVAEWSPLPLRTAPTLGPNFFSFAPGLLRRVLEADLNLVHLHGLWMHPSAVSLAFTRRTGKPHLVSPHGMLDPWALGNSSWKKRLAAAVFEKENLKRAACLHALNAAEAGSIRDYGFAGPVCVIPNGVEVPPADQPRPAAPWWTKAAPEVKTLLYLGRLHPKKGLPALLEAWRRLDPGLRKEWRLLIAGWDERGHQVALRRMASMLRIEATVTFPGPLFGADKKAAYHHCHGFILPSLSEGLPMAVLEAWACGKPVLMTPQCNLPEGFETGAAQRIEPEEKSIAGALTDFLSTGDAQRECMGAKGRALVLERFSWPVIAADMAAVYRWLAGHGAKPASVTEQ